MTALAHKHTTLVDIGESRPGGARRGECPSSAATSPVGDWGTGGGGGTRISATIQVIERSSQHLM